MERPPVPVGPGRPPAAVPARSGPVRVEVNGFPIQLAKVQRPALRDETLERPRLLDWLRAKIHGRVILILADAGYGKTTLLADFSRRIRTRTLWYRLDDDDRDWVSILHHLVAAGREHDPAFAPSTAALLTEVGIGGPTREAVLEAFLRELPSIAVGGAVLILDDFHLVDDAPDVKYIVRELIARAPERFAVVFASRRVPTVPLAKLRAVGEVAELGTDDLRFDANETRLLFTETYGRQLEPDVLADLTERTEGWIASLQMVQAALRDRSPVEIRRFVRGLSGGDQELYDYLAEEVVGDLAPEMQRFLMETSILQIVTPELAAVVTGLGEGELVRLTAAAERLTLLSRLSGGPRTHQRYHPLVRGFLETRLRVFDGPDAVAALHRRTAAAAAASDWRIAAYHYREAGDTDAMLDVVGQAIPTIMGNGQYALAETFIGPISPELRPPGFHLILSRVDMQHGDYEAAIAASQAVLDAADDPIQRDHALLNLLTLHTNIGNGDLALDLADRLERATSDQHLSGIAQASAKLVHAAYDGDLDDASRLLARMATTQIGFPHHLGVTAYNLAWVSAVQDKPEDALRYATEAIDAFESTSSDVERSAAQALRATALAMLGRFDEAQDAVRAILHNPTLHLENELLIDAADLLDSYGAPELSRPLLDRVGIEVPLLPESGRMAALTRARALARVGATKEAAATLGTFSSGRPTTPGITAQQKFTAAYIAFVAGDPEAAQLARDASTHSRRQRAHRWWRSAELLLAHTTDELALSQAVASIGETSPWQLTFLADLLASRLEALDPPAMAAVNRAAQLHPVRWRVALRHWLDSCSNPGVLRAARLLETLGERSDIKRLRSIAKRMKRGVEGGNLGKSLARRLADRVFIEDQGRVQLRIGERTVLGTDIRRKVLALVCFLLTKPDMSATRDQVLDALWPDLGPELALNSLNQTLYFLRRVIEEDYAEDLSPGYVNHDSDLVWLDSELTSSRSALCRNLIRTMPAQPSPDDVERLVSTYKGRFALDFEYEEWASAYRDWLHASYLEIVERSVQDDLTFGHPERGISVARRALEVDPLAEQVEVSLLRLYKATGAHSAAAEQYSHYAELLRSELGIEPPPLESV
jgi:ATP/maltotriose-dependent transcriptional regulator MalT/DNA-binding SARP family transcriptional activator